MDKQLEYLLKFICICACFVVSLVSYRFCFSKRDCKFLIAGMFLTVVSDFFLVLRDMDYAGYYIFFLVHAVYILRVSADYRRSLKIMAGIAVCFVPFYFAYDLIIATAAVYAGFFIYDVVANINVYKNGNIEFPRVNRAVILAGLILFMICDLNIIFFNLPRYFSVPKYVADRVYPIIWVSYLSSQVLLSVSAFKFKRKKA